MVVVLGCLVFCALDLPLYLVIFAELLSRMCNRTLSQASVIISNLVLHSKFLPIEFI